MLARLPDCGGKPRASVSLGDHGRLLSLCCDLLEDPASSCKVMSRGVRPVLRGGRTSWIVHLPANLHGCTDRRPS